MKHNKTVKFVDLFAGLGGIRLGFERAFSINCTTRITEGIHIVFGFPDSQHFTLQQGNLSNSCPILFIT